MVSSKRFPVLLIGTALAAGCADEPGPSEPADEAAVEVADAQPAHVDAPVEPGNVDNAEQNGGEPQAIDLQVVDKQGYEAVLQKHSGKVVLVDFWATWCVPCRREFPHTVEWSKTYADDLAVVAVSMDDEDAHDRAKEFLESQQAAFDTLVSEFGSTDKSYDMFEIESVSLPHYKIYDRSGKLFKKFEFDENDPPDRMKVEAALKEALAQPAKKTPAES